MSNLLRCTAAAIALSLFAAGVQAQSKYPNRPVRLLTPFGASRVLVAGTVLLRGCIELRPRRQWQDAPIVRLSRGWLRKRRRRQHALLKAAILEVARLLRADRRQPRDDGLGSVAG